MLKTIEKAEVLIDALPFIQKFNGKTIVVKYGGSAMTNEVLKQSVLRDITLLKQVGLKPIIVHGGGKDINTWLSKVNVKSEFKNGFRVTDSETMEVAEMVLSGKVNKNLVQHLEKIGTHAVGISGKDGATITVEKKTINGEDIGFVGEITKVDDTLIKVLLDNDFTPVISSIGLDEKGHMYNINADDVACAIAKKVKASKLVFLTDIEGVMLDPNDKSTLISELTISQAIKLFDSGVISGGMLPKIKNCVEAVKDGVNQVHIVDGRVNHCLLLEIFTANGIGTLIKND